MGSQDIVKIDLDDLELEIDAKGLETQEPGEKASILRSSFRVPVGEQEGVQVTIGSRDFRVLNISENGLQVLVRNDDSFQAGQIIDPLILHCEGDVFQLKGKAAYVNQIDFDQIALGLELIFSSLEQREALRGYHKALRKRFFQK